MSFVTRARMFCSVSLHECQLSLLNMLAQIFRCKIVAHRQKTEKYFVNVLYDVYFMFVFGVRECCLTNKEPLPKGFLFGRCSCNCHEKAFVHSSQCYISTFGKVVKHLANQTVNKSERNLNRLHNHISHQDEPALVFKHCHVVQANKEDIFFL